MSHYLSVNNQLDQFEDVAGKEYYGTGEQGIYPVTNYMQLEDIDLTKPNKQI